MKNLIFILILILFQGSLEAAIVSTNQLNPSSLHPPTSTVSINIPSQETSLKESIPQVLASSINQIMQQRLEDKYWKYPMYLGTMYTSQYYLLRQWLESGSAFSLPESPMNKKYYINLLEKSYHKQDGSWSLIEDANEMNGDLNATIMHYAVLKAMNYHGHEINLEKTKQFILSKGGIEKSSLFTKVILALFGNYSWKKLPSVPYLIFNDNFIFNYKDFGQWIGPHLFPISYFKKMNVQKNLGDLYNLSELYLNSSSNSVDMQTSYPHQPGASEEELISKMLSQIKPHGSFGGYTSATLFTLIAYNHFQQFSNKKNKEIQMATLRGLNFVDELYFNSGDSAYLGVTCDGRYWDTALIGQGLIEAGLETRDLAKTADYLLQIQDKSKGGFGFGYDFETYMDTDDTAETLIFLHHMGVDKNETKLSINWLLDMQNKDGGWGAFDKNNTGNPILKLATKDFLDSADMFDESSPDVTGHILEALALYGYNRDNSEQVAKAVKYLEKSAEYLKSSIVVDKRFPAWSGRWGSNYIYGTSASVIGLTAAGVNPVKSQLIKDSMKWLKQCQNSNTDGGFGESFLSYSNPYLACKGVSTPSQTAWALMALIAAGEGHSDSAKLAAQYLVKNYLQNQKWTDGKTFVGTGHPKIVPMHYPAYAWSFPLMALSRYYNYIIEN